MGHKINPKSFRLNFDHDWKSKWFAGKEYADYLVEDIKIRRAIEDKLGKRAGAARIDIERSPNQVQITIHTSKPGIVIGRGGSGTDELKKVVTKVTSSPIKISVEEVRKPELSALLVAENIASQLERRISFRRAIRMSVENSMKAGAKGVKVRVGGRLGGSELARRETAAAGSIPLHTIRADIDFGQALARTTYGIIGVKVWIYKGEKFKEKAETKPAAEAL